MGASSGRGPSASSRGCSVTPSATSGITGRPSASALAHSYALNGDAAHSGAALHYATTKALRDYSGACYGPDDFLVFGRETKGLPEELLAANYDRCVRIPMREGARSLNLSNSVAVVLYEALRQQGFPDLVGEGRLTGVPEGPGWRDYV